MQEVITRNGRSCSDFVLSCWCSTIFTNRRIGSGCKFNATGGDYSESKTCASSARPPDLLQLVLFRASEGKIRFTKINLHAQRPFFLFAFSCLLPLAAHPAARAQQQPAAPEQQHEHHNNITTFIAFSPTATRCFLHRKPVQSSIISQAQPETSKSH